jgi:hypothetical protein
LPPVADIRGADPPPRRPAPSFAEAMARLERRMKGLGYEIDEEAVPPRADDEEAA